MELPARPRRWLIAGGALLLLAVVLVAVRATRRDRVEGHAYDIPSSRSRILVEVLNGTSRNGLARQGTRQLRGQGLDVVAFGSSEATVDSTRILVRRGERAPAERVRAVLGVGQVQVAPDSLLRVDVTVILGPDFRPAGGVRP